MQMTTERVWESLTGQKGRHPECGETTGDAIRRIRKDKGWSQTRLADVIGGSCTQSRVSLWESGLEPSWLYRRPILEALGVEPAELGWA